MEANGADLVEFWNWATQRGEMNGNTATALRGACKEVLQTVEPETWETIDLRTLDVDNISQRFLRLKAGSNFKPDSLSRYQARFRRGVESYLAYLDAPDKWSYETDRGDRSSENGEGKSKAVRKSRPVAKAEKKRDTATATDVATIEYPFPLRPYHRLVVTLTLPTDLSRAEAKRLGDFINSLAVDAQPALPPAPSDRESRTE